MNERSIEIIEKIEIIKATERLFNMTSRFNGELKIEYGTCSHATGEFVRSETEITHVLLHYVDQPEQFGYMQSIEGDSGLAIIYDIVKAVKVFE